ncbi:hypothetical protein Tco_0381656 [Tanacetum coccineum]
MTTSYSELGFLGAIYEGKTHQDLHTCLFACFLSQKEPKRVSKALSDPAWVEANASELLHKDFVMSIEKLMKDKFSDEFYWRTLPSFWDLQVPTEKEGFPKNTPIFLAVKRIFRYLKAQQSPGLWYSKDFPLELFHTLIVIKLELQLIGEAQPLAVLLVFGNKVDLLACTKQTVAATSTTEAE